MVKAPAAALADHYARRHAGLPHDDCAWCAAVRKHADEMRVKYG